MATPKIDWIKGRIQSRLDAEGFITTERCIRVTGVTGAGSARHLDALKVSGMPQLGDPHPHIIDMVVESYRFDTIDDRVVDVYPIYERRDDPDIITVVTSAYTTDVETNRDFQGKLLTTEFADKEQSGRVVIPLSGFQYTISRTAVTIPDQRALFFVGTYNSGPWKLKTRIVEDARPGLWRCESYDTQSPDNETTWNEVIVIRSAPIYPDGSATWDQDYVYNDPETGRVPDGVIKGSQAVKDKAIKVFDGSHPRVDFNGFGF